MITGLDSSFSKPTPAQAAQAYAAGVRVWGGYLGSRNGLGLAVLWSQADFDVIKAAGMTAIGYCSGWDDPAWIRDTAAAWGILPCVDVEAGIRTDGPWIDQWVATANSGLYGNASVHYETGQPIGRGARFNVVSGYFGYDPRDTWEPWLSRPSGPCGWQWQGGHSEFGLDVDRSWFDDWFAPSSQGVTQMLDEEVVALFADWYATYAGRWPSASDLGYIRTYWLPQWRANPVQARADFGNAAAGEVAGKNVYPVRHFELDDALAKVPAGPPGPPGPAPDVSALAPKTHTHDVTGATGPAK